MSDQVNNVRTITSLFMCVRAVHLHGLYIFFFGIDLSQIDSSSASKKKKRWIKRDLISEKRTHVDGAGKQAQGGRGRWRRMK
jgi:hypothetical protein